jgi:hydrogenase maturation protease
MISEPKTVCIIGIGNTIRSDDGIGAYICQQLQGITLEGVTIKAIQQQTEWISALSTYDHVIIIDTCNSGIPVSFHPLPIDQEFNTNLSHHLDASALAKLAYTCKPTDTILHVCLVAGESFEAGATLSLKGKEHAEKAFVTLKDWLVQNGFINQPHT